MAGKSRSDYEALSRDEVSTKLGRPRKDRKGKPLTAAEVTILVAAVELHRCTQRLYERVGSDQRAEAERLAVEIGAYDAVRRVAGAERRLVKLTNTEDVARAHEIVVALQRKQTEAAPKPFRRKNTQKGQRRGGGNSVRTVPGGLPTLGKRR